MLKTKIKRYEFGVNIVILAFIVVLTAVTLMGAYGSICLSWLPEWYDFAIPPGSTNYAYPWIRENLFFYQTLNILLWVFTAIWGFVIYSFLTGVLGNRTYLITLILSAVSFVLGIIPALMYDTKGFTIPWEGMGSPRWGRTLASLLVFVVIAVMFLLDYLKKTNFKSFTAKDNRFTGNVGRQLMLISVILLWLSAVFFLGTQFMSQAHVIDGINVWQPVVVQGIGGFITLFGGISTLGAGLIYNQIKPPTFVK